MHEFDSPITYTGPRTTHTHTQPFYGPLSGIIWVSRCQKRTCGFYGGRED